MNDIYIWNLVFLSIKNWSQNEGEEEDSIEEEAYEHEEQQLKNSVRSNFLCRLNSTKVPQDLCFEEKKFLYNSPTVYMYHETDGAGPAWFRPKCFKCF